MRDTAKHRKKKKRSQDTVLFFFPHRIEAVEGRTILSCLLGWENRRSRDLLSRVQAGIRYMDISSAVVRHPEECGSEREEWICRISLNATIAQIDLKSDAQ